MILEARTELAVERLAGPRSSRVLLTCEHASDRIPDGWRWHDEDAHLEGTHWAYDLGAADLTRALAAALGAPAVLSRFSRLLVDPNRAEDSPTLILGWAEGREVALNRGISEAERHRRIERLHRPYHAVVDASLAAAHAEVLFSIHSFTPVYEGSERSMEIGVLFDAESALAEAFASHLEADGFAVALNQPYSGRSGLIYAAHRHATQHGRRALELEVRQDLAVLPEVRARLASSAAAFFGAWG